MTKPVTQLRRELGRSGRRRLQQRHVRRGTHCDPQRLILYGAGKIRRQLVRRDPGDQIGTQLPEDLLDRVLGVIEIAQDAERYLPQGIRVCTVELADDGLEFQAPA